jgi:hypothetical protein
MQSPSLQSCPSDGVATNRPDGGQHCDGTDEIKPVSSHDIIRWLREAPSPTRADESLARHETGQFLSQTGAPGHLPSILAANSAVSKRPSNFAEMHSMSVGVCVMLVLSVETCMAALRATATYTG